MTEVKVSPLPIFDIEKALLAKEVTYKDFSNTPNVRAAGTLWLYNSPPERWPIVLRKLDSLRQIETSVSHPENPLPTIGWEVEIPRKPFTTSRAGMYALFFDFMGLPRNKIHTSIIPGNPTGFDYFLWEFSTVPAYSAAVANRTLCELIKGGFIPYLLGPATASDRRELLDDKLVSLHINLGIPPWLYSNSGPGTIESQEDVVLLASGFEFAYTSSERFTYRAQSSVVGSKGGAETTAKNKDEAQAYRLELKAFEVGTANTYRLMQEIQLVAAATFCAMADRNVPITTVWQETKPKIQAVYQKYYLYPEMIVDKTGAANKVKDPQVQRDLRKILTDAAHQVSRIT